MYADKQTMSNAIAQNTNLLAVSGPGELDLIALVRKVSARKANGLTRQSVNMDRSAVFSAVAAEFKSFSGIERKARLADEIVARIDSAIDTVHAEIVARFHEDLVSYRVFAAHKASQARFVLAETIRRESAMPIREQEVACQLAINQATKRLDRMVAEYRDEKTIERAKKALVKLETTMNAIISSIKAAGEEPYKP